jgi:CRP-like cAMP-binding protein
MPHPESNLLQRVLGYEPAELRAEDKVALQRLLSSTRVRAKSGERLRHRKVWLAAGWACQMLHLPDGRQQILDFIIPGDFIGFGEDTLEVRALTQVTLLDATALAAAPHPTARLAVALRSMANEQRVRLEQRVLSLGRRTAIERVSHLLLELERRLVHRGLGDGAVPLPVTQEALGDALGLSIVHVNRTLQRLRHEGLIRLTGGQLTILDHERLEDISDFKPYATPIGEVRAPA